jgi:hypothetical protein
MSVYSRAGHITGAINASMLQLVDKTGRSRDPHASLELANGMHRLTRRGNLISFISNKTTPKRAVCCLPDEAIRDRRAYGVIGSANLAAWRVETGAAELPWGEKGAVSVSSVLMVGRLGCCVVIGCSTQKLEISVVTDEFSI